jgi:hypothetical protein
MASRMADVIQESRAMRLKAVEESAGPPAEVGVPSGTEGGIEPPLEVLQQA